MSRLLRALGWFMVGLLLTMAMLCGFAVALATRG